jgi:hypothetical protein
MVHPTAPKKLLFAELEQLPSADLFRLAGDKPEPDAAAAHHGCINLADAWSESGVGEDLLEKWTVNIQAGLAPEINVVRAPENVTAPVEVEELVMA